MGHSPTRRKYWDTAHLNSGSVNANALPLLISNKGPTIPVGPPPANPTRNVAPLTGVLVGPFAWQEATRTVHVGARVGRHVAGEVRMWRAHGLVGPGKYFGAVTQ